MRSGFILAATITTFAAFSFGVRAQSVGASRGLPGDGSYTITGKVMLPDGKAAANVRVDVSCDYTNTSTNTGDDGSYRVTGIPAGNCTVTARVPGFDPVIERKQITRDTPFGQATYIPLFVRANPYTSNPAFANAPKAAIEKFKSAMEKVEKGDNDGALPLFDQAIAIHPKLAPAWYQKGLIMLKKNDADKAVESFVKAIEINPEYIEAKYGFGMAQFQKKNYEVSEAVFRDVIKQKGDMPEAHMNLGISLYYLKQADAAEAELKSALSGKGGEKLAMAHLYLGQIYAQKKRNAEAANELQKYVDLVPKAPNAERVKTFIADLKKQS
jgi:Tfp pilus assembly protein PilF